MCNANSKTLPAYACCDSCTHSPHLNSKNSSHPRARVTNTASNLQLNSRRIFHVAMPSGDSRQGTVSVGLSVYLCINICSQNHPSPPMMSDSSETPLQTSSTSIHNLTDDILIYVFTLNADMFAQKYALYTTHITSHVCRQWRDLLLGASYLWARLIDLDLLCNDWHHVWRNEIIRRSEGAPLWIRFESERISYRKDHGAISAPTEYISEFFCRIVKGKLAPGSRSWSYTVKIGTRSSTPCYAIQHHTYRT